MDSVTIIRIVAAVLFCIVLVVLIQRRRSRVH
jgi:preprotein translocase subunit SecG